MFIMARVPSEPRRGEKMAGTRTAPTVDGNPTLVAVSMKFVDADNGETTVTFAVDPAILNATVEAVAAKTQAMSNASLYEIAVVPIYRGARAASNAVSDDYVSVKDSIRLSYKNISTNAYIRAYAPSPLGDLIGSNAVVDTSAVVYTDWKTAVDACLVSGYSAINVAFVQYTARNKGQAPTI
jgi:hypothetical protein